MIEAEVLSLWNQLVASVALIAIVVLALCVMVRLVKLEDVPRRFGQIVGIVILLIMLPAIIISSWHSMTFTQDAGIIALGTTIALLLNASRRRPHNSHRR